MNDIERLEQKIDANKEEILNTINELHNHEEKINENSNNIQKNSYALEILRDYKKESRVRLIFAIVGWLFAIMCLAFAIIK